MPFSQSGGSSLTPASLAGFEIGYDQLTTTVNIASSTEATPTTIMTCAPHTFDGSPVFLDVFAYLTTSSVATVHQLVLFESTTEITRLAAVSLAAAAIDIFPIRAGFRFTPTAASHTYIIAAFVNNTTGTQANVGGSTGSGANAPPMFARFTKV